MSETITAFGRQWKRVWQENIDTKRSGAGHEYVRAAWTRLFGEAPALDEAGPEEDHPDGFYFLHRGRVVDYSDDSNAIYVPVDNTAEQPPECATCPERADFETLCCKGPRADGVLTIADAPPPVAEYVPPVDPYAAMAREFRQQMDLTVRDEPDLGTPEERETRVTRMLEELLETARALGVGIYHTAAGPMTAGSVRFFHDYEPDLSNALHELADLQVAVSGTAAVLGLPLLAAAREVHRANMRKQPDPSGGKAVKPPGWVPADVSGLLNKPPPVVFQRAAGDPPGQVTARLSEPVHPISAVLQEAPGAVLRQLAGADPTQPASAALSGVMRRCTACNGSGELPHPRVEGAFAECPTCGGTGRVDPSEVERSQQCDNESHKVNGFCLKCSDGWL